MCSSSGWAPPESPPRAPRPRAVSKSASSTIIRAKAARSGAERPPSPLEARRRLDRPFSRGARRDAERNPDCRRAGAGSYCYAERGEAPRRAAVRKADSGHRSPRALSSVPRLDAAQRHGRRRSSGTGEGRRSDRRQARRGRRLGAAAACGGGLSAQARRGRVAHRRAGRTGPGSRVSAWPSHATLRKFFKVSSLKWALRGVPYLTGCWPVQAFGENRLD